MKHCKKIILQRIDNNTTTAAQPNDAFLDQMQSSLLMALKACGLLDAEQYNLADENRKLYCSRRKRKL